MEGALGVPTAGARPIAGKRRIDRRRLIDGSSTRACWLTGSNRRRRRTERTLIRASAST